MIKELIGALSLTVCALRIAKAITSSAGDRDSNSDASSSLEVQAIRIDGVNEIKLRSGLEDNRSLLKF